ncbi:unnamed protein product, partial [Staurois parvus]
MSLLKFLNFPPVPSPVRPDARRDQKPTLAGGDGRGHCRGDTVGTKDKVREVQILEQRCKVFPSIAQGYRLCYTQEYRQGG